METVELRHEDVVISIRRIMAMHQPGENLPIFVARAEYDHEIYRSAEPFLIAPFGSLANLKQFHEHYRDSPDAVSIDITAEKITVIYRIPFAALPVFEIILVASHSPDTELKRLRAEVARLRAIVEAVPEETSFVVEFLYNRENGLQWCHNDRTAIAFQEITMLVTGELPATNTLMHTIGGDGKYINPGNGSIQSQVAASEIYLAPPKIGTFYDFIKKFDKIYRYKPGPCADKKWINVFELLNVYLPAGAQIEHTKKYSEHRFDNPYEPLVIWGETKEEHPYKKFIDGAGVDEVVVATWRLPYEKRYAILDEVPTGFDRVRFENKIGSPITACREMKSGQFLVSW